MTSNLQLFSALDSFTGPALTWYGPSSPADPTQIRQELGGGVVSRWLAKIANLLGTDLADLFGGPETPRSILLDLPGTWQETLWALAASCMGWEIHFSPASATASPAAGVECDVLVSNGHSPSSDAFLTAYLENGADVLMHDTTPLALSWTDQLPAGAVDALEAIMSQPDARVVDLAAAASPIPARLLDNQDDASEKAAVAAMDGAQASSRVLLAGNITHLPATLRSLWERGASVVVIAPESKHCVEDAERERIFAAENCTL